MKKSSKKKSTKNVTDGDVVIDESSNNNEDNDEFDFLNKSSGEDGAEGKKKKSSSSSSKKKREKASDTMLQTSGGIGSSGKKKSSKKRSEDDDEDEDEDADEGGASSIPNDDDEESEDDSSNTKAAAAIEEDDASISKSNTGGSAPNGILYRNRRGTKTKDLFAWELQAEKPIPAHEMSGFLTTQQYLQQLIRRDPSNVKEIVALPENVDEIVWIYEHFRQLLLELNDFVIAHNEVCTKETSPSMRINVNGEEFVFLCSGFEPPKEVSAIDYMTNTIAHSASIISSNKIFPSRVVVDPKTKKHFKTLARRLYRIFAFSYYHYQDTFDKFESQTHLCERFTKFLKTYKLMSSKLFLIPESRWKPAKSSRAK